MILVSGGTGMLGAHLLYKLTSSGSKVTALKRSNSRLDIVKKIFSYYQPEYEELFAKIEWVEADMLDKDTILKVCEGAEFIYHAAAMVTFDPRDREKVIKINTTGTKNMVNAALMHNVKKFCHVSSITALGESYDGEMITEETFRNPKERYSGYSMSKYLSELEVWRGITEGLNAVIINPGVILGPGNWQQGSPSFFSTIHKGLRFFTEGKTAYVDVIDTVEIMIKLMESDISAQRYIVAGDNLSYKDVFVSIAKAIGAKVPTTKANKLMLGLAWRFEELKSRLFNIPPLVTRNTAHSAQTKTEYSSKKLIDAIDYQYTPIMVCINRIAEIYKKETIGSSKI